MADPQMKDFYGRLRRINKIHRAGGGFEASGTLGMSYYSGINRRRNHAKWLLPVALLLFTIVGIKAAVHANIGSFAYESRIAALRDGDSADRIGAYVLQADPLTLYVADFFRNFGK